jgi:hypothetical protein
MASCHLFLVREAGFEPAITGPEPVALPLGYSRILIDLFDFVGLFLSAKVFKLKGVS